MHWSPYDGVAHQRSERENSIQQRKSRRIKPRLAPSRREQIGADPTGGKSQ